MSSVTKPLMLDETGRAIAEALTQEEMTQTRIEEINAAADTAKDSIQAKADEQAARIPEVLDHETRIGRLEATRGYATPEMFGAAGDGITDDTQALQDAINSGHAVLLTGRYKISEVKLPSFVTMTGSPGGRIVDGKICMCPYSSMVGVIFEVTSSNTHTCVVDIGTYGATGVTESGGDNRYTIKDIKVVTDCFSQRLAWRIRTSHISTAAMMLTKTRSTRPFCTM